MGTTGSIRRFLHQSLIGLGSFVLSISALANPVVENIATPGVSVTQTQSSTTVTQTTQKGIVNWRSFNIGAQEGTHFQQPAGGVTLNRINGANGTSQIFGMLTASGRIILINPAGIYFGPSAFVNVGSIIATTANITDENFLAGKYQFDKVAGYSGVIQNEGTIIAAQNGLVALVAPGVINNGMIKANLGKVVLGSADAYTMSFDGDNLVSFTVDVGTSSAGVDRNGNPVQDGVKNTGMISANGGSVIVSAKAAAGVLNNVINMEGVVEAQSVGVQRGEIILSGDTTFASNNVVRVAGKLNASGKKSGEKGGRVSVTSTHVVLDDNASIDVSGDVGGGEAFIGGNFQGLGPMPNATTLEMKPTASVLADAITNGNGGQVALWSNEDTKAYGSISARGGEQGGDGGFIETSAHNLDVNGISINTFAPNGMMGAWLLDPNDLTIQSSGSTNAGGNGSSGTPYVNTNIAGSNILTVATLTTALASGNVFVQTINTGSGGNGDIIVASPISWSSGNTLNLTAYNRITINTNSAITGGSLALTATASNGSTGSIITINSPITLSGTLSITAPTTSVDTITTGTAGTINVAKFNLLQGNWSQLTASLPAFSAADFQIASGALAPTNVSFLRATSGAGTLISPYTVVDVYGLQGINSNTLYINGAQRFWRVAANIDATGTRGWNNGAGFVPIGNQTNMFSGVFEGQNYAINGLYENYSNAVDHGLFGRSNGGLFATINLTNTTIAASNTASLNLGGLVGYLQGGGTISQSSSTDAAIYYNGALVGSTNMGTLVGGVDTGSTITESFGSGSVIANFTGGSPNFVNLGGLVGSSYSPITNSYSTASVAEYGTASNLRVGGFVGDLEPGGSIQYVYSSGAVSATGAGALIGGLVGNSNSGSIANSLWDVGTSGRTTPAASLSSNPVSVYGGCFGNTSCVGSVVTDYNSSGTLLTNQAPLNLALLSSYTGTNPGGGWPTANATNGITAIPTTGGGHDSYSWIMFDTTNGTYPAAGSTRPLLLSFNVFNINTPQALQLMGATLGGGSYNLTSSVSLTNVMNNAASEWGTNMSTGTGNGFVPIGISTRAFTGSFDGKNNLGYTIDGLYINTSAGYVGLFGYINNSSSTIQRVGLTNANILASAPTAVGILAGYQVSGTITNAYTTGSLYVTNSNSDVGGVVGRLGTSTSIVSNVYNTASITATGGGGSTVSRIGGVVGINNGGSISQSYNAGEIKAIGTGISEAYYVGGITGFNNTTLSSTNIYNLGNITVAGTVDEILLGGLVGWNVSGTTSFGYNTGMLNATINTATGSSGSYVGGVVGFITNGTISNALWDIATSNQSKGYSNNVSGTITKLYGGCFGNTTCGTASNATNTTPVDLALFSTYNANTSIGANWGSIITATPSTTSTAPTNTWFMFNGGTGTTRPMLMMEYSTSIGNAHQLQLAGSTLQGSYTLSNNIDLYPSLNNQAEVWGSLSSSNFGGGFVPIGTTSSPFTGSLDGQNYVINNLYINTTAAQAGLFDAISGGSGTATIQKLGVANVNIIGANQIGGLVAAVNSTGTVNISKVYTSGNIVSNSYGGSGGVGGLAGQVQPSSGTVTISDSYSLANVTTTTSNQSMGGFVGYTGGTAGTVVIQNAYSTGRVTSSDSSGTLAGGFAGGLSSNATVLNSFWDTDTSGRSASAGSTVGATITNLTGGCFSGSCINGGTANLSSVGTYNSSTYLWFISATPSQRAMAPSSTWFMLNGYTRPMLSSEWTTSIMTPHQLQMAAASLGASYTLSTNIDLSIPLTNKADVWGTNSAVSTYAGKGFFPIGFGPQDSATVTNAFIGSFNGQGYVINGLYQVQTAGTYNNGTSSSNNVVSGLFGTAASNATIKNIGVTNASITGNDANGILIGNLIGTGVVIVSNAYSTGSVTTTLGDNYNATGGLIGVIQVGGIANLTNSYSTATVTSNNTAGGLLGYAGGGGGKTFITNVYSSGPTTSTG